MAGLGGEVDDIPEDLLVGTEWPGYYNWANGSYGHWCSSLVLNGAKWRQDSGQDVVGVTESDNGQELSFKPLGLGISQFTFYDKGVDGHEYVREIHRFTVDRDPVSLEQVYRVKVGDNPITIDFSSMVNPNLQIEVSGIESASVDLDTKTDLPQGAVKVSASSDKTSLIVEPVQKGLAFVGFYLSGTAKNSSLSSSGPQLYCFHVLVDKASQDDDDGNHQGGDSGDNAKPDDGTGDADNGAAKIKTTISDTANTRVKVEAQLGGSKVQDGAEAIIEVKPCEVPSGVTSAMTNKSLGAFEVKLFVRNPGDAEAHEVRDSFGAITLSFPIGKENAGNTVRLHHLHEGGSSGGSFAYYTFRFDDFPANCKVALDENGKVISTTLTIEFNDYILANEFAGQQRLLHGSTPGVIVNQPSRTSVSVYYLFYNDKPTLDDLKENVLQDYPEFTIVSEPGQSNPASKITTREVAVKDNYAKLDVTDLSVFVLESMAVEASSSSSSTQASGTQQLTPTGTAQPTGKVGGSMVNSGDSVDVLVLVAAGVLAILSVFGAPPS